ncbi:hypothetical protein VCHA53O466_40226 [Vibrio chagasii]|nr:hypothetical protein VCHA53O466_40226 [Vibrio chagasii]
MGHIMYFMLNSYVKYLTKNAIWELYWTRICEIIHILVSSKLTKLDGSNSYT